MFYIPGGTLLPLPMVRGSVAGRPTVMVVDSGTGSNVIAGWLARSLKLETTPFAEKSLDPSGRAIALQRCDAPQLRIDGLDPLPDRPTPVIDLPAAFEIEHVGAIISPQTLAAAGSSIIIDLPRMELRRVPSAALDVTAPRAGTFDLEHPLVCNGPPDVFTNTRLTATATIDGLPTLLEVDTGAYGTPLFVAADTDVGRKVLARAGAVDRRGLSGAGAMTVVVSDSVPTHMAGADRAANVSVAPGTRDPRCGGIDGRVGIDWLRACVLVISDHAYQATCDEKQLAAPRHP